MREPSQNLQLTVNLKRGTINDDIIPIYFLQQYLNPLNTTVAICSWYYADALHNPIATQLHSYEPLLIMKADSGCLTDQETLDSSLNL